MTDRQLLNVYTTADAQVAQDAFAELVRRYANLVYRAARRQCADDAMAQDVTQAVFLLLAQRAKELGGEVVIAGWLIKTARYSAKGAMLAERRRKKREEKAARMTNDRSAKDISYLDLRPILDEALVRLNERDRGLVAMRYLESMSLNEVAAHVGAKPEAVRKRIARAMDKMRAFFARRGWDITPGALPLIFGSASEPAAPSAVVQSLEKCASRGAATSAAATSIAQGASQLMLWAKLKVAIAVAAVLTITIGAVGGTVIHLARAAPPPLQPNGPLELADITFEPIGQGKNVAHVMLKNRATTRQSTPIIVQARSGDGTVAWKSYMQFGSALPGALSDTRIVFQIPEPFARNAPITFNFYKDDDATVNIWKSGRTPPAWITRQFLAGKFAQRSIVWDQLPRAADDKAAAAKTVLAQVQQRLHLGLYGRASELFTTDWGVAENAPIRDWFRKRVYPKDPTQFTWDAGRLQQFEPRDVLVNGEKLVLLVGYKTETRAIEMMVEKGKLKIDWIYPAIKPPTTTQAVTR